MRERTVSMMLRRIGCPREARGHEVLRVRGRPADECGSTPPIRGRRREIPRTEENIRRGRGGAGVGILSRTESIARERRGEGTSSRGLPHLEDVGFQHLEDVYRGYQGKKKAEMVNDIRRQLEAGDMPPAYPNGWFAIFESDDLPCGGVRSIQALAPTFAKVKTHLVKEAIGYIWIWFHAEGEEPTYEIPRLSEIHEQNWKYSGRTEHYVNVHIQEIPENGPDVAHLSVVHRPAIAMGTDLRKAGSYLWNAIHHTWNATWAPLPHPKGHIAHIDLTHKLSFFEKFYTLTANANIDQVGPSLVIMRLSGAAIGELLIVQVVTPVGPLMQRFIHRVYSSRTWTAPLAKLSLFIEALNVERDLMVWNNKRFEKNPALLKEERPIRDFRRWYSQFYSENSPKFEFANKMDLR
ncbi:unnamed protein product [Darwinula stevensoni]|uniref:3-ketosteroid-9-alpha-monooxygenase oxygenase component-like C-terminal domain-containing protein n=1 Tax=Darwinula stevensoni TaxID=69355 RepID=A0A7R9ABM6_9CRUS|nr:unnamed protein product [Darwinula stevensoni]CAG0899027.1 unnamed protein product [Darwinula stevensoni]